MAEKVTLPAFSMFLKTPVYEVKEGQELVAVFGLQVPAVVKDGTDEIYEAPPGDESRLDNLSFRYYGVPDLWWVLALVNDVIDPMVGITPGSTIRVPTKLRLANEGVLTV